MAPTTKVLGSIRLSRLTDESTSPARQRERIEWWTSGTDAELVEIVEDLDVSGALSPFERPALGSWLTDSPPGHWTVLVALKLDRVSRNARDTMELLEWLKARGKRLVCVDEGLDTATDWGKVFVQLAAVFAEVERTRIAERAAEGREKLRRDGRWGGEAVHYGYRAARYADGWRLEKDPIAEKIIGRMVRDVLAGASVESIAESLTREGVSTPRDRQRELKGQAVQGKHWNAQTIFKILESRTLLGHTSYKGDPVIVGGQVIEKAPAILTHDEHKRVVAALAERKRTKSRTVKASPLLGVALCHECSRPLHHRAQRSGSKTYRYYYCTDKHGASLRAHELEQMLEEEFLAAAGRLEVLEPVHIPAEDHTAELDQAKEALAGVLTRHQAAKSATARQMLEDQVEHLDSRISDLEAFPPIPARTEYRATGRTYAEEWQDRDTEGRRSLLLQSGITLKALRTPGTESLITSLWIPEDQVENMASQGASRSSVS